MALAGDHRARLTKACTDRDDETAGSPARQLPQTIGHRGYKAAYPENSMAAFRGAVAVGAHAIETDVHLSRDGVAVLTHDRSLRRCFGVDGNVGDRDWRDLSRLQSVDGEPRQGLPRLTDLLAYLAEPGLEHIWVLLDIKRDDDAVELIGAVAASVAAVPVRTGAKPWSERLMLGCWSAVYVRLCQVQLPGFPVAYIGSSLTYARELLRALPGMHFNLNRYSLAAVAASASGGGREAGAAAVEFVRDARAAGGRVFLWTVNAEDWMEWAVSLGCLDGVVTDEPELFLDVCERWRRRGAGDVTTREEEEEWRRRRLRRPIRKRMRFLVEAVAFRLFTAVVALVFLLRIGSARRHVRESLRG